MAINNLYADDFLANCPQRNSFRQRGFEMTCIEVFTDAAMAFALIMLVISLDRIPTNYEELMHALRGAPVFAICIMHLMLFWAGHLTWSRRQGLEDIATIWLSGAMVFVMLIFVYPLKLLMAGGLNWMSGGCVPSDMEINTLEQLRNLIVVFGAGYAGLSGILVLLNIHALRIGNALQLNDLEKFDTRAERNTWSIVLGVSVFSLLPACAVPHQYIQYTPFSCGLLGIAMPVFDARTATLRSRRFVR